MNISSRRTRPIWYAAAFLFACSAVVFLIHHDVVNGCFWLIMSALCVIFARTEGDRDREDHGELHRKKQPES